MSLPERGAFRLITLRSGARAVQHTGHGEVMHPSMGPWAEAQRLYVEGTRLTDRLRSVRAEEADRPLRVWDVGLGAGTNATAVLACARALKGTPHRTLELHSFENDLDAFELALTDTQGFDYLQPWTRAAQVLLRDGLFEEEGIRWKLWHGDFFAQLQEQKEQPARSSSHPGPPPAELVLFDPFSPKANPALWTRDVLEKVRNGCAGSASPPTLLATYSASTRTRVSLLLAGWFVGVGPSTGDKSETTVAATSRSLLEAPLGGRWLERWSRSSARAPHGEDLSPELERAVLSHPQFTGAPTTVPPSSLKAP